MWVFFEGKHKILLSQWLTFKLFGEYISYLVGNTKFKVLYQDTCGWVRNIYIDIYMYDCMTYTNTLFVEATKHPMELFRFWQRVERCQQNYKLADICSLVGCFYVCFFHSFPHLSALNLYCLHPKSTCCLAPLAHGSWMITFIGFPLNHVGAYFIIGCVCVCVPISICINEFSPCSTRGKNAEANCCLF